MMLSSNWLVHVKIDCLAVSGVLSAPMRAKDHTYSYVEIKVIWSFNTGFTKLVGYTNKLVPIVPNAQHNNRPLLFNASRSHY